MEDKLKEPLQIITHFLESIGYRYAIIGGLALSNWGVIRITQDVDIKILVPDANYSEVREKILENFPERARLHIPANPLIVAVKIQDVIVDLLLALPGYEELIINRAVQRDLDGWVTWICTAEDLILQKVVAGRKKDWGDVEELLIEQHGKLDNVYIEYWLNQFAEALENPELLTRYHELFRGVERIYKERFAR